MPPETSDERGSRSGRLGLRPSHLAKTVMTIQGEHGNDPFENLRTYTLANIPAAARQGLLAQIETLKRDVSAQTAMNTSSLLASVPNGHREAVAALVEDLRVFLIRRRNAILRMAAEQDVTRSDAEDLFRRYCVNVESNKLDPDLPKIAAQVVVSRSAPSHLLECITEASRACRTALAGEDPSSARWQAALRKLGKLIAFTRWVPHAGVEAFLLDILRQVRPPQTIDDLRLHISVLRALFCRPRIGKDTIAQLLDVVRLRFDGPPPMELRGLLRTLLIKGGARVWHVLDERIRAMPDAYLSEFFLDAMSMIDKPATAGLLAKRRPEICKKLGRPVFLRLFAKTGEWWPEVETELLALWHGPEPAAKSLVLQVVNDLHGLPLIPFLARQLEKEPDLKTRLKIAVTVTRMGTFDDTIHLVARTEKEGATLHYQVIGLLVRRLLDSPKLLATMEDFTPLYAIQSARARLHELYLCLVDYGRLLRQLAELDNALRSRGLANRLSVAAGAAVSLDMNGAGTVPASENRAPEWHTALARARQLASAHRDRAHVVPELARLLRDADSLDFDAETNVYGQSGRRFVSAQLLDENELLLPRGIAQEGRARQLSDLIAKTEQSLDYMRERFLYREWFVREIPFVLHERIPDLLYKIKNGEPIGIDAMNELDAATRRRLRQAFEIFAECTRHGIYLTDILLDHITKFPPEQWGEVIEKDLTHRRSLVARGDLVYHATEPFCRHLEFTTFAHATRYGKESLERLSITHLWLRYLQVSRELEAHLASAPWPSLPPHPKLSRVIGPLTEQMYEQQAAEGTAVLELVDAVFRRFRAENIRVRVIPNLTYGLFCIAPVIDEVRRRGIHVSFAGVSSRFCDDANISDFYVPETALFPMKQHLFSNASNYGTLNHDRVLVVVDGTMEPLDRHDAKHIRLPKAYRGYVNHLAAINYIRAKFAYEAREPEREVAAAMNLSRRYALNLSRTLQFKLLVSALLPCFDREELARSRAALGTGRTYYSFAQWNPDKLPAWIGSIGYRRRELPCTEVEALRCPALLFVSANSLFNRTGVPAFFDNNPEVEKPRIVIGPRGTDIDVGWPHTGLGMAVSGPHADTREAETDRRAT